MRKRLAMGAALIHRPQLFLMDEPFEGVDAVGARLMKDILLEQVRRGATVFLTSHVLEVVERLCDRLAIINRGKIVLQGTLPELRAQAEEGARSLEDIFVHVVGADRSTPETLSWLRSPSQADSRHIVGPIPDYPNYLPRSGWGTILTALLSTIWYSIFTAAAVSIALEIPGVPVSTLRVVLPLALLAAVVLADIPGNDIEQRLVA